MSGNYRRIEVRKLAPALGAEVLGVDMAMPLDDETLAELRDAWQEHLVLVLPDQHIDDDQHVAFSRRFGALEVYPVSSDRGSSIPEVIRVSNCDPQGRLLPPVDPESMWNNWTETWHTDSTYIQVPAKGSLLYGIEVPNAGADTLFSNLAVAYEALPGERQTEYRWRRHDVVMWENLHTMHARTAFDFANERRIMRRTTLAGEMRIA